MADLGAIASVFPGWKLSAYYYVIAPAHIPQPSVSGVLQFAARRDGTFAGNAKTAGVNEPHVDVFVLWRPTMRMIAHTRTDADGNWELGGFDPTHSSQYAVVYKDPATGTAYNDAIYSLAVPA